tara:strand:- start:705 stop:812 length:108 start_codon:yes stop_codon:yes gene_type:complete
MPYERTGKGFILKVAGNEEEGDSGVEIGDFFQKKN